MIIFRGRAFKHPVTVTITGTGDSNNCYAVIDGTKYYSAQSDLKVMTGDTITFGVYGPNSSFAGYLSIDGVKLLSTTDGTTRTYVWTVPEEIQSCDIALNYTGILYKYGRITVTTS